MAKAPPPELVALSDAELLDMQGMEHELSTQRICAADSELERAQSAY